MDESGSDTRSSDHLTRFVEGGRNGAESISPEAVRERRRLRLNRFGMGVVSVLFVVLLATLEWRFSLIPLPNLLIGIGAFAVVDLVFLAAFLTHFNERMWEPSLTSAQIFWTMVPTLYLMYYAGAGRAPLVMLAMVAFLFGVFRLGRRQYAWLTAAYLAGYAFVIALADHGRNSPDLRFDILLWVAEAIVLLQASMLGSYLSRLRSRLRQRNEELRNAFETIRTIAGRDDLTGVPNRRHLLEVLDREMARSARHGSPLSLAMIDIDRFKSVNDRFGHNAGDRVLVATTERMVSLCRGEDVLGRFGGEEFLLILPDTEIEDAWYVLDRLRQDLAQIEIPSAPDYVPTFSAGVAEYIPGEARDAFIGRADAAMYEAKGSGRDRVHIAMRSDPEVSEGV